MSLESVLEEVNPAWCNLLSRMRSDVLYLLRSEGPLDPERGVSYARLLAGFAALGFDLEGEDENDVRP